jgi:hypothetical protein
MVEVFQTPGAPELWERAAKGEDGLWAEIFDGFGATVDWPSSSFYDRLARHYPDAKIILTTRDADKWFESTQNTIFKALDERLADTSVAWNRMAKLIVADMFDGRLHDRDHVISVYKAHNERVRRTIPAARLLDYQVSQGWEPLCKFLGVPVPATPFPRVNSTEEFQARIAPKIPDKS